MHPIRIVTVTGASGSGKSSTVREILARRPDWKILTSLTTREPRSTDLPGEYEYGLAPERLDELYKAGKLQWAVEHHGHRYATPRQAILDALSGETVRLMPVDPAAARHVRDLAGSFGLRDRVRNVYLRSPSEAKLRERFARRIGRGDMTAEEAERRIRECAEWDTAAEASDLPYRFMPGDISLREAADGIIADVDNEAFRAIFRANVSRLSRTAKGKDEGSKTSASKKPLLLQGDALRAKVAANVEWLIDDVLDIRGSTMIAPSALRAACERWFDIANDGLYGPDAYDEEFAKLEAGAARLARATGESFPLSRRYRLWTPGYTTILVPPILLDRHMSAFYQELTTRIMRAKHRDTWEAARVMAYADFMMNGEVHPWMDGCGRVSTTLVMAIARELGVDPPLFAETKEGHYATILDIDLHTAYLARCIERPRLL